MPITNTPEGEISPPELPRYSIMARSIPGGTIWEAKYASDGEFYSVREVEARERARSAGAAEVGQSKPVWYEVQTPGADFDVSFVTTMQEALELNEGDPDAASYITPLYATPAPAAAPLGVPAELDMRAVCDALGFDPTNHHNAAKCPYCRPAAVPAEANGDLADIIRALTNPRPGAPAGGTVGEVKP